MRFLNVCQEGNLSLKSTTTHTWYTYALPPSFIELTCFLYLCIYRLVSYGQTTGPHHVLGICRSFTLKKSPMTLIIRYEAKATIRPIIAKVILFLAASTFVLSPWDMIHWIPPKIRNIRVVIKTVMKRRPMPTWRIFPKVSTPPSGIPATPPIEPPGKLKASFIIQPLASSR